MNGILKTQFSKLPINFFLTLAASFMFIADLLNIIYINSYWLYRNVPTDLVRQVFRKQGMHHFGPDEIEQVRLLIINSMASLFLFFLAWHLWCYFRFAKKKRWAYKYAKGYALTGALLTFIELIIMKFDPVLWSLVLLLTALIYVWVWLGTRYFQKSFDDLQLSTPEQ